MFRWPGLPITGTAIVRGHGRRSGEPQRVASFDIKLGLLNGPHPQDGQGRAPLQRGAVHALDARKPAAQGLAHATADGRRHEDFGRRSKNPWVVNLEARLRSTPEPMAKGYT